MLLERARYLQDCLTELRRRFLRQVGVSKYRPGFHLESPGACSTSAFGCDMAVVRYPSGAKANTPNPRFAPSLTSEDSNVKTPVGDASFEGVIEVRRRHYFDACSLSCSSWSSADVRTVQVVGFAFRALLGVGLRATCGGVLADIRGSFGRASAAIA